MKKYTKAIAGAMALVSAVTAFSGCSCRKRSNKQFDRFNNRRDTEADVGE